MRLEVNEGNVILLDDWHRDAVNEYHWRAYTHDDGRTWEVATDCFRNGIRTARMLSRFLMERIEDRELSEDEIVRRVKHYERGMLDYRDDNLMLAKGEFA